MTSLVKMIVNELSTPDVSQNFEFIVSDLPDAMGDKTLVRQVWVNLISNAIKYTMRKPRGIIEISGQNKKDHQTYTIKDNGVGFNPEYQSKLFGVFQRLHKASEFEGTGVGLTIVKRIINRHNGQVWAEGQEGVGATFSFSLPGKKETNEYN